MIAGTIAGFLLGVALAFVLSVFLGSAFLGSAEKVALFKSERLRAQTLVPDCLR